MSKCYLIELKMRWKKLGLNSWCCHDLSIIKESHIQPYVLFNSGKECSRFKRLLSAKIVAEMIVEG